MSPVTLESIVRSLARVVALFLACTLMPAATALHVSEAGAVPDDGKCDLAAIHAAIRRAVRDNEPELQFAAGTYNLVHAGQGTGQEEDRFLYIRNAEHLALVGQVDHNGRPATRLEREVPLSNDARPESFLHIEDCRTIAVRNFVLANNPPFGSTGRVVSVNERTDRLVVQVLEGLPAYDGMRCASAHAWNLETGKLKRFGSTPREATLTIGVNVDACWQAVPGTDARRLSMTGAGFARKVEVGDGISWHHTASADAHNQTVIEDSTNVVIENIIMPNVTKMGLLAGYNHNLTLRKVRFEPENGNLAVGGRDGMHLSMTSGRLLVEECYFKGLRMDPLVLRKTFGVIREMRSDSVIVAKPGYDVPPGDEIRFWAGKEPIDRPVRRCKRRQDGAFLYVMAKPLPAEVIVDTPITYRTYSVDEGIIRDCVFEDNFGSAIVNFEENILVENCVFDNNAYQIKYGANRVTGAFARNNVFRNNVCANTSWIDIARRGQPACLTIHSLNRYFDDPMYNQHIDIVGNVFRNPHRDEDAVAIDVRNALDIEMRENEFVGFGKHQRVHIDKDTTRDIRLHDASGTAGKPEAR